MYPDQNLNRYNQATGLPVAGQQSQQPPQPTTYNPVTVPPEPYGQRTRDQYLSMLPSSAPLPSQAMADPQGYQQSQQQQTQSIADGFQPILQGIAELGMQYPNAQELLMQAGQAVVMAMNKVGSDSSVQGIPASLR